MDFVAVFDFMKSCLKEWNYPQIHAFDDAQIADIFSASNRPFLVAWILKRIYPEHFAENENYMEDVLGNFLYETGFCNSSQKGKLFSPQFYEDQPFILYRLFKFLKVSSKDLQQVEHLRINDITNITDLSINMFPSLGPIKHLSVEERENQKARLQTEIEKYNECVKHSKHVQPYFDQPLIHYTEQIDEMIESVKTKLPDFVGLSIDFVKCDTFTEKEGFHADPQMEEAISRCANNMRKISQYIKDIKVINDFTEESNSENVLEETIVHDKEAFKIIKSLSMNTSDLMSLADSLGVDVKVGNRQ